LLEFALYFRANAVLQGFAVALVSAVVCGAACASNNNVPDWVKAAAQQELPHYPATTTAVVLLDETTYTVAPDGKAVEHVRRVVKILRPQGREEAVPVVWYDKDSKVLSMHVWAIGSDGHEFVVKDNEIADVGIPGGGGELYNDERARVMADPPGRDPGGVVAYEYELRARPYLAETTWRFQGDIPVLKENFTLLLPEGFTQTTTWAHHKPDAGIDMEHQRWRWEMERVASVRAEERVPMAPAGGALAGRMTVHYAQTGPTASQEGTWRGIGEWYDGLSRDRLVATPDIAAKAAELTQGKTDFYDKVEPVAEYAQQKIRYVAVEMGVGGYQPHAAADVFHEKYGDCKDKATLLSSMLSTVGVHSALLMVHTERGVIDPDAPSIMGNHMITAIEIPKGYESAKLRSVVTAKTGKRYLIFDPTWDKTPFGQLESNLQGSYGVLMEGKDSQVIELPILDPGLNTIRRTAKFKLLADGSLKGDVTDKRFGDLAETRRTVFTHEDAKEQQRYMDRVVARDFSSVTLSDLKVENAEALNKDLTTTYSLDAAHFAKVVGPLLMVRPRVLGSYSLDVDRKKREIPIDLEETMRGTDEFDIALPEGYVVDELPDPVKLDVGFASYESSTELRGKSLHYSRTYTMRNVTLPADRYPALQKLAGAIDADEASNVVLKKAQ
jgi:Domain of Unknown Function with PDB structure (DUF3857)/Transglutaminase-like superfamily